MKPFSRPQSLPCWRQLERTLSSNHFCQSWAVKLLLMEGSMMPSNATVGVTTLTWGSTVALSDPDRIPKRVAIDTMLSRQVGKSIAGRVRRLLRAWFVVVGFLSVHEGVEERAELVSDLGVTVGGFA
ncbi:BZ3500_MvSof-1268-A1-R1_Chr1-3g01847 [Microbotryum saponariae]|uniref:BZ3500_MvSof-1268-A1-R1_Chr1-3g01847 protein n=1 Tax=Microbotryum saponariae TaxID=289078 RepID=A0A2X0KF64_9BASI|nr:BZ3500_MvSof-1268-A1-R1_Chr1-3g01847 [Microbotryum saponariae]SCZ94736.1 BZ3501_MvSof-1269-A2-R1_Chr1-3g01449 [Microbotryum saponariae]